MMKRKVSVIWVVVLAIIAIAACAFAAVTYYRCGKQPEPVSYTHLTLPTT